MQEPETEFRLFHTPEPVPVAQAGNTPDCHTYIKPNEKGGTYLARMVGYDRDLANGILDEAFICHVAYRAPANSKPDGGCKAGFPVVMPKVFGRDGDMLYFHGSPKARMHQQLASKNKTGDVPDAWVCVNVAVIDGISVARSAAMSGIHYRSVTIHGEAIPVSRKRRKTALRTIVEHVMPNRSRDTRMPSSAELDGVTVLGLKLEHVSTKVAYGDPHDLPGDVTANKYWAGTVPVQHSFGRPFPSRDLPANVPLPYYLTCMNEFRHFRPIHPAR
ncbi:pyridoxamine 5'-phosphate oxidase family protein [Streptomyces zagrosensis]|uniref:Flavin-nucleotide-binding protein n=1 Tax=Streptomyces zagrosensis TaxID=1042984 RepID=A0A7W9QH98_9ACTN|nr:pyridoxamine 5'-phosphate oxidase family protein [Streptomyces zagrosensis]MBB5940146.1 hypothetical protein [Streptomyces zagrosensis]